jgi:inulin fructotransferase (DFA-I-forming)
VNGKTGIYVASANDSFRVTGMGFVYLEHALTICNADALSIHDNFIAECGSCIELRGWGQASKVTDNLIGAGPRGHSIYAQNHGGLLITANNVFPRGSSSVSLDGVTRSSVTNNRSALLLPGHGRPHREARRTSSLEPLPARSRAVDPVLRSRQRARRPTTASPVSGSGNS